MPKPGERGEGRGGGGGGGGRDGIPVTKYWDVHALLNTSYIATTVHSNWYCTQTSHGVIRKILR